MSLVRLAHLIFFAATAISDVFNEQINDDDDDDVRLVVNSIVIFLIYFICHYCYVVCTRTVHKIYHRPIISYRRP